MTLYASSSCASPPPSCAEALPSSSSNSSLTRLPASTTTSTPELRSSHDALSALPQHAVVTFQAFTNNRRPRNGLFLIALIGMLSMATLLTVLFIPRDEHSPRMLMHPLSSIKHSAPQSQEEDHIRYLTFGSSSTWGEGLDDPHQEAYPWLLSESVHNVAARVGGISLSAICTQSIVGDGIYDVIVVEFTDVDAEGVVQLAQRLRQRFPYASLVFVRLWSPVTHVVYDETTPLLDWWKQQPKQQQQQQQYSSSSSSKPEAPPSVLNNFEFQSALLNSDAERWSFVDFSQQAAVVDAAIQQVNGLLYELPFPKSTESTTHEPMPLLLTSPTYMTLFQDTRPHLLSMVGHQIVAHGIQETVLERGLQPIHKRNEVGSWGSGDACALWYGTGDYSSLRSRRRTSLVDFSRGDDGFHKHALEISRRGGSVQVTNPFQEPRMLYLTYMTAAQDNKTREYPRTKIMVGGRATVLIDPIYEVKKDDSDVHLTRTSAVGMVPPGRTTINLQSLDADSVNRFRLVGLHFLNEGKMPIPFEFEMEPDSAHR